MNVSPLQATGYSEVWATYTGQTRGMTGLQLSGVNYGPASRCTFTFDGRSVGRGCSLMPSGEILCI